MRKSRLLLALMLAQAVTAAYAASVPANTSKNHKQTKAHKQSINDLMASTYQEGNHVFVGVGYKMVDMPAAYALRTYSITRADRTTSFFNRPYNWVSEKPITLGLHFHNEHFLTGLMGDENSITATYGFAQKKQSVDYVNDDPSVSNGTVINKWGPSGGYGPLTNAAIRDLDIHAKFRSYNFKLSWNGHKTINDRFSMDPSISFVYQNYREDQDTEGHWSYTYLQDILVPTAEFSKIQSKYIGASFSEKFNFKLTPQITVAPSVEAQVLHADYRNANHSYLIYSPQYTGVPTLYHANKNMFRGVLGLNLRYSLFNRTNSAYIEVYGGTQYWSWVPYMTNVNPVTGLMYLKSKSYWVPYWGAKLVIPYA